ncbi:MAG: glycosyltransferase family 39 protein [Planctomycetes bacterium]|nr:glycosyltransferase family 39 protein [Planctomycetota bacterium]
MEPRAIRFAGEASRSSSPWQRLGLAVLVVVGALTLFYRLGSIGLIDADEPRYSEAAREMRERGDLLVPWLNGEPRLNKPALVYWAIAASQSLFGTNEWASRLPSGLAALATTIVIYRWARRRSGSTAAAFSALVFVTSPLVVMVARLAIPDMALTAFETFAVLNLYRSDRASHERSRSRARLAAWASLGLAAMTKGPVGVVVPLLVLVVFLALEGRLGNVRRLFSMPALALFVAISLPWYVAVGFALGFREGFELLVHETLYRYSSASFHSEPMTFFLGVFAVGFLPWIPSLAAALAIRPDDEGARERRFLLAWIGVVLVFFSLSPSKLPTYILPLAPAVALLVGTTFDRAVRASASARERTFARLAVGMGAGLVAVAAAFAGVVYGIGEGATDIASLGLVLAGIPSRRLTESPEPHSKSCAR